MSKKKRQPFSIVSLIAGGALGAGTVIVANSLGANGLGLFTSIVIWYLPAVFLHEIAHAVAMVCVGGVVTEIRMGTRFPFDGTPWSIRLLGFPWKIYSLPLTGIVYGYLANPRGYRISLAFVAAAGPLVSLMAGALGALPFFTDSDGPDPKLLTPLLGWIVVNVYLLVKTSIPYKGNAPDYKTDGQRILDALALTDEQVLERCFQAKIRIDLGQEQDCFNKLPMDAVIAKYEAQPNRIGLLAALVDRLVAANDRRQDEYAPRFISWPDIRSGNVVPFLDAYITGHLNNGTIGGEGRFDEFTQKLLALTNNSVTALGTRGAVLIDLGRIEEGEQILREVLEKTKSEIDKAYSHIFLALAEKKRGNLVEAGQHAREAKSIFPECPALKRVGDLLSDLRGSNPQPLP